MLYFWYERDTAMNVGSIEQAASKEAAEDSHGSGIVSPFFESRETLVEWLNAQKKWCVFLNIPSAHGYISQMGLGDGNFRGSGCYPYTYVDEYNTQEEAEHRLRQILGE